MLNATDIDYPCAGYDVVSMKPRLLAPALALALAAASPVAAQCFADYKAKQDNPLRLHYGVAELPAAACGDNRTAAAILGPRLQRDGWILLQVMSTFGPEGLESRRASAGRFFLRY
jgi:hypothetical protein